MIRKYVLDHRQFGFRKHLNCAFAHHLLKHILTNAENLGNLVYFCSVDIQAALDSVVQSKIIFDCLIFELRTIFLH